MTVPRSWLVAFFLVLVVVLTGEHLVRGDSFAGSLVGGVLGSLAATAVLALFASRGAAGRSSKPGDDSR